LQDINYSILHVIPQTLWRIHAPIVRCVIMTTRPTENCRCCHLYISRLLFSLCSEDLRERCLNHLSALLILSQQVFCYSGYKIAPPPFRMTRGNTRQSKVYYKGRTEDFVIFVADITAVQNWRKDHTLPLAQVMDGWKIFTSHQ
jgi:hypothetical protein